MKLAFPLTNSFKPWLILLCIAVLIAVLATATSVARADNPIVQHIYTADPAPLVYNGRVYVYTGHDEDGSTYFTMRDWRVWSSTDMVNWTDHGSPLSLSTFSWASQDAWAGQAIYRNGKFYWYVPVRASNGAQHIGVAVSDSPTGPFSDPIGRPLVSNAEIDPTVFIDDNGQAYLYYGNPNLWYVRLNADMISYSGTPQRVTLTTQSFGVRSNTDRPTSYEEAPWLFKRNNLYYMMFAGGPIPEHIAYSTGPSATGPWTYRGVIMPTQGSSFTNHAGIVDFAGNSYFFYHNGALPGGGGFTRSVAVERFTYNADGTIPTMNMTTAGAPQIGTLNPYVTNEAETIAWGSGIETEAASEGGRNVAYIDNGDYIKVKGVNFGSGATSFEARVASAASGGNIELRLDSATGTLVGTCSVQGTGGWQTWVTRSCGVNGATGTHDLFLRFTGGSGSLFNVNWWRFIGGGPTPTTPPPTTPPPTTPAGQAPYSGTPAAIPGTIQAENYDTGGEGVAYHDTTSGNSGNAYRTDGVDVESTTDSGGGYNVGWTDAGEWLEYTVNVAAGGTYTLNARVASQSGGGTMHVEFDGVNVTGALAIPSTGGWQTWTTVTRTGISLSAGQHVLRIAEDSAGFNVNWVSLTGGGTPPPTTPPPTTPPPTTPAPTNLLTNGNAESGTSSWGVFGSGSLSANTSVVHGGSQSLLLTGRTGSWNGISQNVTSKLTNGRSYTTNVWMRTQSGTPTAKVTLAVTANGSTSYISLAQGAVNSSGWTLLSGTATVSWTGTLSSATFYVETTSGTDSFYIDDASFQ